MILEAYKYISDNAEQALLSLFHLERRTVFQFPDLVNTNFLKDYN